MTLLNYDDITLDRLEFARIKLILGEASFLYEDQLKNSIIIEPAESVRTDEINKIFINIDPNTRHVKYIYKNRVYHDFIYPDGTTHFVYNEFKSDHFCSNHVFAPIKIDEDFTINYRKDGAWCPCLYIGPRVFKDDEIKSIDDLINDQINPKLRVEHPMYAFIKAYSNAFDIDYDDDVPEKTKAEIKQDKFEYEVYSFIKSILILYEQSLFELFETCKTFDNFIIDINKLPNGNVIAFMMKSCNTFERVFKMTICDSCNV